MASVCTVLHSDSDGNLIYYAGSTISGYVEVSLSRDFVLQGIFIEIVGRGETYLKDGNSAVEYNGSEKYMNAKKYVYGDYFLPKHTLKAGKHKFNFEHKLPNTLPYSLKLCRGDISYHVETFFHLPGCEITKSFVEFSVIRGHDMIQNPTELPKKKVEIYNFGRCFRGSGSINVSVTIPRSGYFSGEEIPFEIIYENNSNLDIWCTTLRLVRNIVYSCETPALKKITDSMHVAYRITKGVKRHESKIVKDSLTIPGNMMSSNTKFCKLIAVSYFLKVEVNELTRYLKPEIRFPIKIGSKPTTFGMSPLNTENFIQNATAPVEEDDLPPSFEEATNVYFPCRTTFGQRFSNIGWKL